MRPGDADARDGQRTGECCGRGKFQFDDHHAAVHFTQQDTLSIHPRVLAKLRLGAKEFRGGGFWLAANLFEWKGSGGGECHGPNRKGAGNAFHAVF